MAMIQCQNVTFAYDGSYDNVFENLTLQLDTDWKTALIGRNGRGKTTLLRLLAASGSGEYRYRGQIKSSTTFAYFPYEVEDAARTTGAILSDIARDMPQWALLREFSKLDLDAQLLDRPFETLSGGERTKALLAALFLKDNSFLLIDEPTNHLDMDGRALVGRYLAAQSGFILVSHDRAFLDLCVDHVVSINKTGVEVQQGNFSSWLVNKERQEAYESKQNQRLEQQIDKLQVAARQTQDWSNAVEKTKKGAYDSGYVGHKAAKMMKRSKAIEARRFEAVAEKSALLQDVERVDTLKLRSLDHHAKRLIELDGAGVAYDGRAVFQGLTMMVEKGERIAVCGKNGSGKSSLLKLICGEAIEYAGAIRRASGLVISYVPQDTSFLSGSISAYARQAGVDETQLLTILRKLGFERVQFQKDMKSLSQGQRKKVLIARSLCDEAHLLVWDEPLNYIDVLSRMQIETLIDSYQPTMLFVEHDSAFCTRMATKVVALGG